MRLFITALCVFNLAASMGFAAFGGKPPLKSSDGMRRELAPYDIPKVNYLGMNYNENLLDMRNNIVSYTHMGFESSSSDAWNLHFPDDTARMLEGVAWEADFSPVVRIELARRLAKGLISAHVPGTKGYYFFRHRSGGKSELTFDNLLKEKDGRVVLSAWGDSIGGEVKIGFRAEIDGKWQTVDEFKYKDTPKDWGEPGIARSSLNWNISPYKFERKYSLDGSDVTFKGAYWMSDEDMPMMYEYSSSDAENLQVVVGEPDAAMPLLAVGNGAVPGIINLPDRKTKYTSDKDGDIIIKDPKYKYIILSKDSSWGAVGYGSACLIMWEGKPEYIQALSKNGYGEIRVSYKKSGRKVSGKVWLFPFPVINQNDMEHVYRNAESFLSTGKLIHNGFPPQQMLNAIPAGLAAGAYILTKYNDPLAYTVRAHAINAADVIFEGEIAGKKLVRVFFPVRTAAWLIKTAKLIGDRDMEAKYTNYLDIAAKRMLSSQVGYDGNGWPGGWDHFNATKAIWLAYDATGNEEYNEAFKRALEVYTIDENGMYRYGKKMDAPGGFSTYFGSMPMGVWGMAGKIDWANQLLELNVPSEPNSKILAKELWHDDGNGPWAQDDANPEYVGLSLKGLNIPQDNKQIIPVGSFPIYDAEGNVGLTYNPIVINPFFLKGDERVQPAAAYTVGSIRMVDVIPDTSSEINSIVKESGRVSNGRRISTGKDKPLVYKFEIDDADYAGIDVKIKGDGFKIDVSPDGRRWYQRMDTWSEDIRTQSTDISFLTGSREELLKLMTITPGKDKEYLVLDEFSRVDKINNRYTDDNGEFAYKIALPDVKECWMEFIIGNSYVISGSSDGEKWTKLTDAAGFVGAPDTGFIRMVDFTPYLKDGYVYVKISDDKTKSEKAKSAFLRRLTVYGVLKSDEVYVRLSNVYDTADKSFELESISIRKWNKP